MDRTTALLEASIRYEQRKGLDAGLGHGFRTDERTYQDFAERLGEMVIEIKIKDAFSEALYKKINALRLECEDMAARLADEYNDRS